MDGEERAGLSALDQPPRTAMEAILRRGRSLHLAAAGLTLYHEEPQRLVNVAQYVYLSAAHTEAVQLKPPPLLYTVERDSQRRQIEPWQLRDFQTKGWRRCGIDQLMQPGADVLVIRQMGLGDVLMLTPALHALHTQRHVRVHLATYARYLPLVWGLDFIQAAYALGTDYWPQRFATAVDLNWAVEWGEQVEARPRQDIFAHQLGVKLARRRPYYRVTSAERQWARHRLAALPGPIVGIQTHASCPQRSYPFGHLRQLIRILQADGYLVLTFGQKPLGQWPEGTVDLTAAVSIRQAAALIEQIDVMICPDSGLLHLAVAVGTATVGLFGPIPPRLRVVGYPRCVALSGAQTCGCSPCFDRAAARGNHDQSMKALSPQQVAEAASRLLSDSLPRSTGLQPMATTAGLAAQARQIDNGKRN